MKYVTYKLKDILSIKHGYPFQSENFLESGKYMVMTPGNFLEKGGFKTNQGKERYYGAPFPEEYLLHKGDLVIAMTEQTRGLLGSSVIVPEDEMLLHNQRIGLVTCDEAKVDKLFLAYLFNVSYVRNQIENSASGTKIKHTSPEKIGEVIVRIPERIEDQQNIASLLVALDAKIDLNSRICAELEAMARTLYDYWFVQFDFPDEHGRPYRSSGGEMVWCQELKKEIPKGWKMGDLYDIAEYINGLACQNYRPSEGEASLPVIKIKEMHEGISAETELVSANIPEKNIVEDGDILFSWSATLEAMYWAGGRGGLNQHIFKVVPKQGYPKEFVYHQISAYINHFVKMAESRKTTMGHITSDHLAQSRIVLPPIQVLTRFQALSAVAHERIIRVKKENRELTQLRDWLLPMLMNGQARVDASSEQGGINSETR